ncbi:MAG: DUF2017 family protein [Acidimicrobiales bacterium]
MSRFVAIRPIGDDRFSVEMPQDLRRFLGDLAAELDPALESDAPALRRLFPTAYPDDPERDAGYQVLARSELVDGHREAIATLRATSDDTEIAADTLEAWMRVVNSVRLVLGTQLDVSEDDDPSEIDPDDPHAGTREIYELLGLILDIIVSAMMSTLDD